ncbi:phage regulator Rha-like protein [Bartonella callosciuri]|uniref:Phage regulator Rha-like protein n=1 Tax=Bartonella callosciuri TaxID=686223 RepID=A0A840NRR1_9HYPH|nr:Rha family transcriptional regulator [Bartonella callosciuri]MBB5074520.1 phage regulator Rha-like protein [Bartonella callosciuri]
MKNLVTIDNAGLAVTTSLKIAEGVGNSHTTVIKLIRNNRKDFEEFGSLGFEIQVSKKDGKGGQKREVAILNEPQATLLMTYMRNNDTVRAFKKALVKAFYEFKSQSPGRDLFSTDRNLFSYESLKAPEGIGKVLGMIAARLSYVNDLQKELDHYKLVTTEAKRVLTNAIAKAA